MAAYLTKSKFEGGLRSAVYPVQWMRLMMICCSVSVKMGMLGASVNQMYEIIKKYFSSTDVSFLGVVD
jgi:hypothetical protein